MAISRCRFRKSILIAAVFGLSLYFWQESQAGESNAKKAKRENSNGAPIADVKCGEGLLKDASNSGGKAQPSAQGKQKSTPLEKKSFFQLEAKTIDGAPLKFAAYAGKVLMVVNTASRCGYTSQYKEMQEVYAKYQAQGFEVLGFPSNDFQGQEPGTNKEIKDFCAVNFSVKFPMFEKGPVTGSEIQPVFRYLMEASGPAMKGPIAWNFEKFIVDRDGQVVGRFPSKVNPNQSEVIKLIESKLSAKPSVVGKDDPTCS